MATLPDLCHPARMRLIGVVSHGNGAGKTRFITNLLEAHPGRFAAVKFTTVFRDGQFCPKDAQRNCACTRLHDRYNVITDMETIAQENTDTGRITAAGATQVIWCLAREGAHLEGWEHVKELIPADAELVTEGNSAMLVVPSDVLVFLVNPCMQRRFWKSNWRPLAERADVIVVNEAPEAIGRRKPANDAERRAAMAEVQEAAPETPRIVARLDAPWGEWAGPLLEELAAGRAVRQPA